MKLRLIFKRGIADAEGKHADDYYTDCIVDVPDDHIEIRNGRRPNVIAGIWIEADE
jgi:hypothetical protein